MVRPYSSESNSANLAMFTNNNCLLGHYPFTTRIVKRHKP